MPEIQIRAANADDIHALMALDHSFASDYVWQMDIQKDEHELRIAFREARLPRSVQVAYPRNPHLLADEWTRRDGLLVAATGGELVGYSSLMNNMAPKTTWITDLVVMRRLRRQGIGSALILASQEWALQKHSRRVILEMQPKNYPAISLAHKLGFELCGYNDHYYINHDIALFFSKWLR
jgi:ribosomal protein S18 acetylase RimI-like enzyme